MKGMVERPNEAGCFAKEICDSDAHKKGYVVGLHANGMLMYCTPVSCHKLKSAFAMVK